MNISIDTNIYFLFLYIQKFIQQNSNPFIIKKLSKLENIFSFIVSKICI